MFDTGLFLFCGLFISSKRYLKAQKVELSNVGVVPHAGPDFLMFNGGSFQFVTFGANPC